MILELHRNTRG